jgi:Mitochondrial carrier protein
MIHDQIYENIKTFLRGQKAAKQSSQGDELLAAAITGAVTAFVTTPLDLAKTKLMLQSTSSAGQYEGVLGVFSS